MDLGWASRRDEKSLESGDSGAVMPALAAIVSAWPGPNWWAVRCMSNAGAADALFGL